MSVAAPAPVLQPSEAKLARRETLRALLRSTTFVVGNLIVWFWIFWAIAGARLTPHDPLEQGPDGRAERAADVASDLSASSFLDLAEQLGC